MFNCRLIRITSETCGLFAAGREGTLEVPAVFWRILSVLHFHVLGITQSQVTGPAIKLSKADTAAEKVNQLARLAAMRTCLVTFVLQVGRIFWRKLLVLQRCFDFKALLFAAPVWEN